MKNITSFIGNTNSHENILLNTILLEKSRFLREKTNKFY